MIIQKEQMFDVRYEMKMPEFMVLGEERDIGDATSWIVRDRSVVHRGDPMDMDAYFHEVCAIFVQQIHEFEALRRKAGTQEQKKLQTTLALVLEAQELLYDEEK